MKPDLSENESGDENDSKNTDHLKPVTVEDIKSKDIGGINLKNVKRKLGKEDKYDRQTERERIKRKHKETRKKERMERQAASDMVRTCFRTTFKHFLDEVLFYKFKTLGLLLSFTIVLKLFSSCLNKAFFTALR